MVCVPVCLSVTIMSPAKTAEPIEMPFGLWTRYKCIQRARGSLTITALYKSTSLLIYLLTYSLMDSGWPREACVRRGCTLIGAS